MPGYQAIWQAASRDLGQSRSVARTTRQPHQPTVGCGSCRRLPGLVRIWPKSSRQLPCLLESGACRPQLSASGVGPQSPKHVTERLKRNNSKSGVLMPSSVITGITAGLLVVDAVVPAAEPAVCVILHSSSERDFPINMNNPNPGIAGIREPLKDQNILRPYRCSGRRYLRERSR